MQQTSMNAHRQGPEFTEQDSAINNAPEERHRSFDIDNNLAPYLSADQVPQVSRETYTQELKSIRRKEPLRNACAQFNIPAPKTANLEKLRELLADYWFSTPSQKDAPQGIISGQRVVEPQPQTNLVTKSSPSQPNSSIAHDLLVIEPVAGDEASLVRQYGIPGAASDEVLGYDDDEELDMDSEAGEVDDLLIDDEIMSDEGGDLDIPNQGDRQDGESFKDFQKRIRVEETKRAEQNRRAGGIKTQNAMVKAWKEFCTNALKDGTIKDEIIDEHHLLLYIRFCSQRPKRDRRGQDIPNTFIGASHIKKLYFGALRIRKEQDANDPSLASTRPATSVHVWDSLKGRMNEALQRVRDGLVPAEDAPDIVANTFLSAITEDELKRVGKGFLMHRELRSVINGHLSWTAQNASGNRGDDFRALRLAELQPYTLLHPNKETSIPCVLGLQGEEKAGASRGMRTKVNPVYTAFIAHMDPMRCPLGAFAFYHHFIHDVVDITNALEIDWSLNKSWRQIRVLHGKGSLATPYHEQSLYNIYVKAFDKANFTSKIKAHLPRHMLGYFQERMGVDASITSRMGWTRGETYYDTYAPALPKEAILGAHGFKAHETYDPIWTRVHVPDQFLHLMCPMAEQIHDSIVGRANLNGAANYWKMVMDLRPYLFQSAAAIFQEAPKSALFRLPALANRDVQNWFKNEFPNQLTLLKANAGSAIDLERIQNAELRRILEAQGALIASMNAKLDRIYERTDVLTPTKLFDMETYNRRFHTQVIREASFTPSVVPNPPLDRPYTPIPTTPVRTVHTLSHGQSFSLIQDEDHVGVYEAMDSNGSPGLRAFANGSPIQSKRPINPEHSSTSELQVHSPVVSALAGPPPRREKTQVDLVMPPTAALVNNDNIQLLWPAIFGQRSVTWVQVFSLVRRPQFLWDTWRPNPSKTLSQYNLEDLWTCWSVGEPTFDPAGVQNGIKPPLRDVESHFGKKIGAKLAWRSGLSPKDRKFWERFREIPEFIDRESQSRHTSPLVVLEELRELQKGDTSLKGLPALALYVKNKREEHAQTRVAEAPETNSADSTESTNNDLVTRKKRKRAIDARRTATIVQTKPH
ncbi:hypothetical protein CVT24_001198 [Panaeolus cyanescens]|uniref:Ndc10 domain-containing protein n=1 Tax=Panaeolus cyanescens TaxID=181874 RepID=A0A409W6Z7_9AGAR|nr:hypothetical protein CVT24_001198 [Panaeolus cyanescens]